MPETNGCALEEMDYVNDNMGAAERTQRAQFEPEIESSIRGNNAASGVEA